MFWIEGIFMKGIFGCVEFSNSDKLNAKKLLHLHSIIRMTLGVQTTVITQKGVDAIYMFNP